MGSRTKPVHGGSGFPHSRINRPSPPPPLPVKYGPIASYEELNRYLDAPKIACLLCGQEYSGLSWHLPRAHSISPRDYKLQFNIPVTRSLCGTGLREKKRAITKNIWQDSPKMGVVRELLKKNIANLDGTKHRTKSVLPDRSLIRKIGCGGLPTNTRNRYVRSLKSAIESRRSLVAQCRIDGYQSNKIPLYIAYHPEDAEVVSLAAEYHAVAAEMHAATLTKAPCEWCGKIFQRPPSHLKRNGGAFCSRTCLAASRRRSVTVPCAVCGTEMNLIPSAVGRKLTCSKKCSSIRKSKLRRACK